ncbi:MAG: hypothetical protein ACK45E_05195 [Ignavibacteria bacterium]
MITLIIVIVLAAVWSLMPLFVLASTNATNLPMSVRSFGTATFLLFVGISLFASILRSRFMNALRRDYVFVDGFSKLELIVPFATFGAISVGLLSRWMKRMGFASVMRTAVPGVLSCLFLLPLSAFSLVTSGAEPGLALLAQPIVFILCLASAYVCVRREDWTYMLPMILAMLLTLVGIILSMALDR